MSLCDVFIVPTLTAIFYGNAPVPTEVGTRVWLLGHQVLGCGNPKPLVPFEPCGDAGVYLYR